MPHFETQLRLCHGGILPYCSKSNKLRLAWSVGLIVGLKMSIVNKCKDNLLIECMNDISCI